MVDIPVNESTAFTQVVVTDVADRAYDFNFLGIEEVDINVTILSDGVTTTLAPSDYAVTGLNVATGGTITLADGVATVVNDVITIFRETAIERLADYQRQGDLRAETINAEQDKTYTIMQELNRDVGRSLKLPIGSNLADNPLEYEAGKALQWDDAETKLNNVNPLSFLGNFSDIDNLNGIPKVSDVSILRAVSSTDLVDGTTAFVKENANGRSGNWEWRTSSMQRDDGGGCVVPDDITEASPGRWHKIGAGRLAAGAFGQSNEEQSEARDIIVPNGANPLPLNAGGLANRFTRVDNLDGTDTISFTGADPVTRAVLARRDTDGSIGLLTGFSPYTGNNSHSVGAAAGVFELTDRGVDLHKVAEGSTPLERWLLSSKVNITNISLGATTIITVDDIRGFKIESLTNYQTVVIDDAGGVTELEGNTYLVKDRLPVWNDTRASSSKVAGTLELIDATTEASIDSSAFTAYTAGGVVSTHDLWDKLASQFSSFMSSVGKTKYDYITFDCGEAHIGAGLDDLYSTVGGRTDKVLDYYQELLTQFRTAGYIDDNTPFVVPEQARFDTNSAEKYSNRFMSLLPSIDNAVSVVSSKDWPAADLTHFDAKYERGLHSIAPAIVEGLERGTQTVVADSFQSRSRLLPDFSQGFRKSQPISLDEEAFDFNDLGFKGRALWNNQSFYCRSSSITLTDDISTSARDLGGAFSLYTWSASGTNPTAGGRDTTVHAPGITFLDVRSGISYADSYVVAGSSQKVSFEIIAATVIAVESVSSIATAVEDWTPVFSCGTPGDLAVSGTQTGKIYRAGGNIFLTYDATVNLAYTTASGDIRISGFPDIFPQNNVFNSPLYHSAALDYPSLRTSVFASGVSGIIRFFGEASGQSATTLNIDTIAPGQNCTLRFGINYPET